MLARGCGSWVCKSLSSTAAMRPKHRLLTGDARVRAGAEVIPIPCSGLLWMLDRIYDTATITPFALIDGLSRMTKHRRARLPKGEVEKRLARWRKESGRLEAREPVAIRYRPVLCEAVTTR